LDDLEKLKNLVETRGLETALHTYYSVYRAFVLNNADPEERGRVQISCPSVGHNPLKPLEVWVDSASDLAGCRLGWFNPPLVGCVVRVAFDNGDPAKPKAYWGGWFTSKEGDFPVPSEFGYVDGKPQKRGFRSRAGHLLVFNDTAGEESLRLVWHEIAAGDPAASDPDKVAADIAGGDKIATLSFDKDSVQCRDAEGQMWSLNTKEKSIILQSADGCLVTLSKDGVVMMDNASPATTLQLDGKGAITAIASKSITLNAPDINLKAAGVTLGDLAPFSAVIFEQLLTWANTHTHPVGPPVGAPTGPGIPPLLPTARSTVVKLR